MKTKSFLILFSFVFWENIEDLFLLILDTSRIEI